MSFSDQFETLTRKPANLSLPADLKRWQRWLIRVMVLLILFALAVAWLHRPFMAWVIARKISSQTGLKAQIEDAQISPRRGHIKLQGLVLHNPPGFGPEPFLRLPELILKFDPNSLRRGDLEFDLVRLDLAELNLITLSNGYSNLQEIRSRANAPNRTSSKPESTNTTSSWKFKGIKKLEISLGKVRSIQRGQTPASELDLQIKNQVLTNITTQEQLAAGILGLLLERGGDFSQGPIDELLRQQSIEVTNSNSKSSP